MRKLATIQTILDLQPIEGADRIEKAKIKDWWVVVQKGLHKVGDFVVYFEIDSFLPVRPEFDFLLKGSHARKMIVDGVEKEGIRLKTIKLKGQISQGLILSLFTFPDILTKEEVEDKGISEFEDFNVSDRLGVIKYEQPIPANLSGVMKGYFPGFLRKTDEERIQNCADILEKNKDVIFYVTEKIDGTSCTYYKKNNEFGACSRNWEMKETEDNTIWNLAKELNLIEKLPDNFAIQGEIIGPGIQNNPLKRSKVEFYAFNVFDINDQKFLDYKDFIRFCYNINIKTVPIVHDIFQMNKTVDELLEFANDTSLLNLNEKREGLVFRPLHEMIEEINGSMSRLSFKVISNDYLLNVEK